MMLEQFYKFLIVILAILMISMSICIFVSMYIVLTDYCYEIIEYTNSLLR